MSGRGHNSWHGGGRGRGRSAAVAPPSSTAPVELLSREMEQKLTLETASSKAVRFKRRPGFGTLGRKCQVRANHFLVEVADKDLHHYDVAITPEVTSKKIQRDVMNQLVHLYFETHLDRRTPAYDGMKSLYTAGPLPFLSKEFVVKLVDKDGCAAESSTSRSRNREFKVALTLAKKLDLYQLQQFLRSQLVESPQVAIQALDVALRVAPSEEYTAVGRSFFSTKLGRKGDLGDGLEYWRGYYQSLRPTQLGLSLNIDVMAKPFYESILVTEYLAKYFNYKDCSRRLSARDCIEVKKVLKRVKVEVGLRGKRTYTVNGLSAQPLSQLMFTFGDENISVVQYYHKKYNKDLKYVALPAIQAGTDSKPVYLPMELCSIVAEQRYTKKLNQRQVTNLLIATCKRPRERENSIKEMVCRKSDNEKESRIRSEFGMQVREEPVLIEARVLPSPSLKYHHSGREKSAYPQLGQWNMNNKKMVNGSKLDFWALVNFSELPPQFSMDFSHALLNVCNSKGMVISPQPLIPVQSSPSGPIEKVLRDIYNLSVQKKRQLQLLIVILPNSDDSAYGKVKRICETELGIVSQCCNPNKARDLNRQYLENLALKINAKVGGRNTVLTDAIERRIPIVSDSEPTIIFGADVTHPSPGDDSSPSIAAVVGSIDWPEVTNYRAVYSAQHHRQEIIKDLYRAPTSDHKYHGGMIRELLLAFYRQTKQRPRRIIFYRDGVSEGQFSQVLLYEVDAIRKACCSLEENYLPPITFVVVQKRHHTRLFPADHNNRDLMDRSFNILPGTVVDTGICHPTEFDFYLNSHAGIQGTSRPAHYHVLIDENGFTADGLQLLTYHLCYTYVRCTRSVSLVPPVYYAHLLASRACHYIDRDSSDGGSTTGSGGAQVLRTLPEIKGNVKEVMFYC